MWNILDTGVNSAKKNMEIDAQLLSQMRPDDAPLLHFYEWEQRSGTYGYFIKIEKFLNLEKAKREGVIFARRPTGGGILFHFCDFAFSALVPSNSPFFSERTLDNYTFINAHVEKTVKLFFKSSKIPSLLPQDPPKPSDSASQNFCMAKPTIYDVMIGEKKVAGAAQRRKKGGYLHQGSIAIALPQKALLEELLLPKTQVIEAMHLNTFSILETPYTRSDLEEVRVELRSLLLKSFTLAY